MVVEVHTAGKPVVPGRALLASIALLLSACALAAGMTWLRSGDPLGHRIKPPGWEISFRPPRRFQPVDATEWRVAGICRFVGLSRQGAMVALDLWRIDDAGDEEASTVATRVLRQYALLQHGDLREPAATWSEEAFGPFEGMEAVAPQGAIVVRAAIVDRDLAFAASLSVRDGLVDDHLYRAFDLTCRSIELTGR